MRRTRFPALDGLRALGALAVLTTHVGFRSGDALHGPFAGILSRMDIGVAIFFAISGFLLYRPHVVAWFEETDPPLTLPYLRNRALRILPALWVAVILAALLVPNGGPVGWTSYLQHATLTQIYTDVPSVEGLTQLWSLATEVLFYLALPVLARFLTGYERPTRRAVRWRLAVLTFFIVLGPVWMATVYGFGPAAGRLVASRLPRLVRGRDGARAVGGCAKQRAARVVRARHARQDPSDCLGRRPRAAADRVQPGRRERTT